MDSSSEAYLEAVETTLRRLALCTAAVREVRSQLVDPLSTDQRADLLIQTEDLMNETIMLTTEVRDLVWPGSPESS